MWNNPNGLTQFYTDSGGDGMPIIFIHGFPFDHSTWSGQVSALTSQFRAITYDVRGHGLSEAGTAPLNIEFFVDDLFSLMDHLSLDKAVLCGLSMGGYIALRAMERDKKRFRGLILCDTRAEGDTNEAKVNRAAGIKTLYGLGVAAYADQSVQNLFWAENVSRKIPEIQFVKSIIEKMPPAAIASALMALAARTDTTHSLGDIDCPVLILVGEHDKITPPIAAETLHENIKDSELVVIPDAGHLTNLENPEDFNRAMLQFLGHF